MHIQDGRQIGPARAGRDVSELPDSSRVPATALREGVASAIEECVAEQVAVVVEINSIAHAVMLTTPADLEDFVDAVSCCVAPCLSPLKSGLSPYLCRTNTVSQ